LKNGVGRVTQKSRGSSCGKDLIPVNSGLSANKKKLIMGMNLLYSDKIIIILMVH